MKCAQFRLSQRVSGKAWRWLRQACQTCYLTNGFQHLSPLKSKSRHDEVAQIGAQPQFLRSLGAVSLTLNIGSLDMQALLSIRVLIACSSLFVSATAFCCSDKYGWKDFSTVSFTTGKPDNITLARFTNGIYAAILDGKSKKEMYQLNAGLILYKGLTASEQSRSSPFFMLDTPIGAVLSFLEQQFERPCLIESSETHFKYLGRIGGAEFDVNGTARRDADSAIAFNYSAVERKEHGARTSASGRIQFADLAPVPGDTDVTGWTISRGVGANNSESAATPTQAVHTIDDLTSWEQERAKQ